MADTSPSLAPRAVSVTDPNPFARFALKQATRDTKPVGGGKRKAAFAAQAPKKQPPKIKFTSAEVGRKLGDGTASEGGTSAKDAIADTGFVKWLKEGNGDVPGYMEAREYLIAGPPYKGDSDFTSKDALKDLGARWVPNPLKEKGVKDGITPGWWSAHCEKDLESLINAPRTELGKRAWRAMDVPEAEHASMLRLMRQYEGHQLVKAEEDAKRRQQEAEASASRSEIAKERMRESNALSDNPEDVQKLADEYDVTWTPEMSVTAMRSAALGPATGISSIRRVLRAIKFNIVTPHQARIHNFDGNQTHRRVQATARASGGEAAMVEEAEQTTEINYRKLAAPTSACSGCYMFGNKNPNHIPIPSEAEWERQRDELDESRRSVVGTQTVIMPTTRRTYCVDCITEVMEQFMDCSCCKDGAPRMWSVCSTCHVLHCPGQACECADREGWNRQQNIAVREVKKMADEADQSLIDCGNGNPSGSWDDDDPMGAVSGGGHADYGDAQEDANEPLCLDNWLGGD